MSGDRRKTNKQCTGTVPKIKHRNNTSSTLNAGNNSTRSLTNNLIPDHIDHANFVRNSRRNTLPTKYQTMEATLEDHRIRQNGNTYINSNVNGSTPGTSTSTSRRNSSGTIPKCDNVSKYPDKKQVEDKLNQIREYLKITTSLMTSMKLTDENNKDDCKDLEKMIADLRDSEDKLVTLCRELDEDENDDTPENEVKENGAVSPEPDNPQKNEVEKVEQTSREIDSLREQQLALLHLQQKAENKLREAKSAQERLISSQRNYVNNMSYRNEKNFADIDETIKALEEQSKRLNEPRNRVEANINERIIGERVDALQNQIVELHNANDNRQELIHVLDNRDAALRSQHLELQGRLTELQNRKKQVDDLVSQLHIMDEGEEDDVGCQVRKIISMKEQLSKLKDMLEIVQNTEMAMTNQNRTPEEQALAYEICTKAENFLQNNADVQKQGAASESNFSLCYDNNTASTHNEHRHKQINKTASDRQGARPKQAAIDEKMSVHAELEAKRRELEAIMGKHKAGTSNLNHDVGGDHKMEFANTSNTLFDSVGGQWVLSNQNQNLSDRYSSYEGSEDGNEYSDLSPQQNQTPSFNIITETKHMSEPNPRIEYVQPVEYDHLQSVSRTPDRNVRTSSVSNCDYSRDRARSNSIQDNNKNQVQKQLELIKSVCESMLEQSPSNQQQPQQHPQQSNVQQLRNNLTPSPIYSEPRRFASPNPHSMNALNLVNSNLDLPWTPGNNPPSDMAGYQNWLSTNTLQSQAFMLNTLNQCCHMLWVQQREMAALRGAVALLQERVEHYQPYEPANHLVSPIQHPSPMEPRPSNNQYRNQQKINQVSAACSMPNLNHYNLTPPANITDTTCNHHAMSNMQQQSARLLDSCLNNATHHHNTHNADYTNNMLHVNGAMNQPLPGQVWNGQALNNQVAPGNRANNYWDNFRSYSRQNLLSTKSNEGLHNFTSVPIERPNNTSHPFAMVAPSKSNSEQESGSTSQENTPRRRANNPPKRSGNFKKVAIPPPDVLNVNHNITSRSNEQPFGRSNEQPFGRSNEQPFSRSNEQLINRSNEQPLELLTENRQIIATEGEQAAGYQVYLSNAFGNSGDGNLNHVKIAEDHIFKDCIPENCRRRNEWHDDVENEQQLPKSKLFDELRENVYKEVATLISANETRPHFLIQLFRDLQVISSDTLRLKILQSIQGVITHSTHNASTQASTNNEQPSELLPILQNGYLSLQSTVWSKSLRNLSTEKNRPSIIIQESDLHDALKDIIPFLNDHEEEVINPPFLMGLKQMFINSDSFQVIVKDSIFQKHFSNVLDDVLEQYVDKRIKDVKMHLIQTLSDMLCGELSFIQLIQETCPENCETNGNVELSTSTNNLPYISNPVYEFRPPEVDHFPPTNNTVTPIQNGDLAEADQSRVEDEEVEEEGAVGGFLDSSQESVPGNLSSSNTGQAPVEDVNLPTIDFSTNVEQPECQFVKQGLDQVPTRLACRSNTRSNTPSRDRSSSSRSEHHSDHY